MSLFSASVQTKYHHHITEAPNVVPRLISRTHDGINENEHPFQLLFAVGYHEMKEMEFYGYSLESKARNTHSPYNVRTHTVKLVFSFHHFKIFILCYTKIIAYEVQAILIVTL
jgi:hypothetical protein